MTSIKLLKWKIGSELDPSIQNVLPFEKKEGEIYFMEHSAILITTKPNELKKKVKRKCYYLVHVIGSPADFRYSTYKVEEWGQYKKNKQSREYMVEDREIIEEVVTEDDIEEYIKNYRKEYGKYDQGSNNCQMFAHRVFRRFTGRRPKVETQQRKIYANAARLSLLGIIFFIGVGYVGKYFKEKYN